MTESASQYDKTASPPRLALVTLVVSGVLLYIGHPTALLPGWVDVDTPIFRMGLATGLALAGVLLFVVLRGLTRAWRIAGLLGGFVLAGIVLLMPSGLGGRQFVWALPTTILLSPLCLLCMWVYPWRAPRWLVAGAGGFLAWVLLRTLAGPGTLTDGLHYAAYAIVPVGVAVALRVVRPRAGVLAIWAGLYAVVVVGFGLVHVLYEHRWVRALTGNPNWTALLLMALLPWLAWGAYAMARRRGGTAVIGLLAAVLVVAPTLFVLYHCRTRAAYVAVALVCGWTVICRFVPTRVRAVLAVVGVLVLAFLVLRPPGALDRVMRDNVRFPLWSSVAALIADQPLWGIGPGRLSYEVAPYAAKSGMYKRPVGSNYIHHPHNDLLDVGAAFGLPGLLLFLIILAPTAGNVWSSTRSTTECLGLLSAQGVVVLGMFDRAWSEHPSVLMALLALGFAWLPWVREREPNPATERVETHPLAWQPPGGPRLAWLLGILAVGFFGSVALRLTLSGWYAMRGQQFADHREFSTAVACFDRAIQFRPNDLVTRFQLADLKLFDMHDVTGGLASFQELHALNPDFSIVNRRIGQAQMELGRFDAALVAFEADAALFPDHPQSWQWPIYCASQAGSPLERIPKWDDRLRQATWERHDYLAGPGSMDLRMQDWYTQVQGGAVDVDLPLCWFNVAHVRPEHDANAPWHHGESWPADWFAVKPRTSNLRYWRDHFWRDMKLRGLVDPEASALDQINTLLLAIQKQCSLTDAPDAVFTLPRQTWTQGAGSPEGILGLQAWFLQGIGVESLLLPDELTLVFLLDGQPFTARPGNAAAAPGLDAALATAIPDHARFFVDPGSLLFRNQSTGIFLAQTMPELTHLHADRSPLARYVDTHAAWAALGYPPPSRDMYWQLPFTAVLRDLRDGENP